MNISYRTILLLSKLLEESCLSARVEDFKDFLRIYGIEKPLVDGWIGIVHEALIRAEYGDEANFIKVKLGELYDFAQGQPSIKEKENYLKFLLKIIEAALNETEIDRPGIVFTSGQVEAYKKRLLSSLKLDGLQYLNGKIIPIESRITGIEGEATILEQKIRRNRELDSGVLLKHLRDSENNYIRGDWKDSISNARHFMEQLLADVAKAGAKHRKESPPKGGRGEPGRVREYLVKSGFFEKSECDSVICGVYSYLSEKGAHRGLTEETFARLARNMILGIGFHVLEKFESWKNKEYKKL